MIGSKNELYNERLFDQSLCDAMRHSLELSDAALILHFPVDENARFFSGHGQTKPHVKLGLEILTHILKLQCYHINQLLIFYQQILPNNGINVASNAG